MKRKSKKQLKQSLFTASLIISTLAFNACLSFGETITPTLSTTPSSQESFENINKVVLEIGSSKMSVFKLCEKTPEFKDIDSSPKIVPLIKDGRTLLPLRSIVETFGGNVSWNSNDNCTQININNKELLFYPGKKNFKINGESKELLVSPEIINGRTYLPLRDFSENTGFVVNWKPADKQNPTSKVEIVKPFTGLYPACSNDSDGVKWGFIDSTGAFIITPEYNEISEFNLYGIAAVKTDDGISFIDSKGNLLAKPVLSNNSYYYGVFYDVANGNNFIINGSNNINYVYSPDGNLILETKMNIQSIYDKLISFSDFIEDEYLYGFIDFNGNIIVSAKYSYVSSTENGVYYGSSGYENGNVETYFNRYGDIIPAPKTSSNSYELDYSDGMANYQDPKTKLYGYKNTSGEIVIKPQFTSADSFIDGFAYATVETGQYSEKGIIINKKGNVVFECDGYDYYTNLGNGLFTSGRIEKSIIDAKTGKSFPSPIFDVEKLNENIICVSEMDKTYFIDSNMSKINTLPTFEGMGNAWINGDILKVSTNKVAGYFKKDGSAIWTRPESILNLGNGIKLHYKVRTYGVNDWSYLSSNPVIEGISDKKVEEKINSKLKEMFPTENLVNTGEFDGETYWETTDVSITDDTSILNNNILVIGKDTYIYSGGAHGYGATEYIHINLKTGYIFTLDDLLKKDSGFEEFVSGYLSKRTGFEEGRFSFEDFDKTSSFKLNKDYLELAFPNFNYSYNDIYKIPYSKIMSFIDTNSVLWNSFDKNTDSILVDDGINQEEVTNLITKYENKFVEAVNSNNFDVLKDVLIPNSSLYESQKALIPELNKKGIKEKLNTFKIEEIIYDENNQIKVTVSENIGISTNGGAFKAKDYLWSYKIARNKDGDLKMYYIENANK